MHDCILVTEPCGGSDSTSCLYETLDKTLSLYTNHLRDNRLDGPSQVYPGLIEPKVRYEKLWETKCTSTLLSGVYQIQYLVVRVDAFN